MKYAWLLLVLISGILVPVQSAMNARMRHFVENPFYSSVINSVVGAVAIVLVAIVVQSLRPEGSWQGAPSAPWWAWCGGIVGMFYITVALLSIAKTGASSFSATVIAGQMIGAIVIDNYGWLHLPQQPLNASRLAGVLLLLGGAWLIQRS